MNGVILAEQSMLSMNGHTQPLPTTHVTTLSAYHIKVEDFVDRLRASVENFFSTSKYRYKEVHVLLLSWEEDDLGVSDEVVELEDVFRKDYGCQTVRWKIPSLKPYSTLEDKLYRFRRKHSSSDNLLIVYYAGHGYLDYSRLWKWAAYRYIQSLKPSYDNNDQAEGVCSDMSNKPPSPTLDWYALQPGLEHAESDVLILLDSCASAGSSGGSKQFEIQEGGTTELLAACGFETSAPGPGPHSFTNALIKELRVMSTLDFPFAVTILHQRIVARLVHYSPQYSSVVPLPVFGSGQPPPERRATPVYISLGRDFRQKSIPLRSFYSTYTSEGRSASSGSTEQSKAEDTDNSQPNRTASAIKRLLGDDNAPKVLLAINLQGEHWQNLEHDFTNWLKDMPVPTDSINIEAVFHGLSTMVLLSMPIAVWDLLPEHPSCSFVSFVQSPNLLPFPISLLRSKQVDGAYANDSIWKVGLGLYFSKQVDSAYANDSIWKVDLGLYFSKLHFVLSRTYLALFFSGLSALTLLALSFNMSRSEYSSHYKFSGEFSHYTFSREDSRKPLLYSEVAKLDSAALDISVPALVIIYIWISTILQLDDARMPQLPEFSGKSPQYWKKDRWSFWETLLPRLYYTFVLAIVDVIDAGLSAKALSEQVHKDGVQWTLSHARYAAMGGFVVQPPGTVLTSTFERFTRSIPLSPRALLQARQAGHLEKLPDVDMTQLLWKSDSTIGHPLMFLITWFLLQTFTRSTQHPSAVLEITACVFGMYTLVTYIMLGTHIFSYRTPTALSLRDAEDFWSRIEEEHDLQLYHNPRTRFGRASWIDRSRHRRLHDYLIGPVINTFWVTGMTAYLTIGTLEATAAILLLVFSVLEFASWTKLNIQQV